MYLNDYQLFLLNRAIYGLKVYDESDLKIMSPEKKQRVIRIYESAQKEINLLKQDVMTFRCNQLFDVLVGPEAKQRSQFNTLLSVWENTLGNYTLNSYHFHCKLTLKDLHITKAMIATRLVEKSVLPRQFFSLTTMDDPRFKQMQKKPSFK